MRIALSTLLAFAAVAVQATGETRQQPDLQAIQQELLDEQVLTEELDTNLTDPMVILATEEPFEPLDDVMQQQQELEMEEDEAKDIRQEDANQQVAGQKDEAEPGRHEDKEEREEVPKLLSSSMKTPRYSKQNLGSSEDVTCPKNRWQTTVTLEAGDKFKYRTQAGRVYRGPVKCTVNYKLGYSCAKARFWCARSFIHNEDKRSCSRGDKMIVQAGNTKKTYCGKRRARINAFGQIKVSFLANKRGRDRGAICNVECTRSMPDVLLVAGGYDNNGYMNSTEVYGSSTCSVPDLPTPTDSVNAVYFDSQVLACGGENNYDYEMMCYTLGATGWSEHSNMTSDRYYASPVLVGDSLYMLGGYNEYNTSVVLSAGSNVWVPGPDIPGDTYRSCAVALGDGFVIIGSSRSGYDTQVLQYDGSSWDNWANLTTGRSSHSCLLYGDSIIVAGGYVNSDYTATTVIIDTVTKISSPGPNMTMPRWRFVFANVNGLLLAVGGYNGDEVTPTGEIFDPINGGTLYQNMTIGRTYIKEAAVVPTSFLAEIIGCP